ncbi:hypothetical protein Hanom_Chr14g01287781 [Helianthus anomalus]
MVMLVVEISWRTDVADFSLRGSNRFPDSCVYHSRFHPWLAFKIKNFKMNNDQINSVYNLDGENKKSKMPFLSLRFGHFCDFRPRFVFPHLDTKGLTSCHFHPAC